MDATPIFDLEVRARAKKRVQCWRRWVQGEQSTRHGTKGTGTTDHHVSHGFRNTPSLVRHRRGRASTWRGDIIYVFLRRTLIPSTTTTTSTYSSARRKCSKCL